MKKIKSIISRLSAAFIVLFLTAILSTNFMKVNGSSMFPVLASGQLLYLNRWAYGIPKPFSPGYLMLYRDIQPGDLVVFENPLNNKKNIKRCVKVEPGKGGLGQYIFVQGDNSSASVDSRYYGPITYYSVWGSAWLIGR